MRIACLGALVVTVGVVVGCSPMTEQERQATRSPVPPDLVAQAAQDLSCPPGSVTVEGFEFAMARVSGGAPTHGARGCGMRATYDCTPQGCRRVAVTAEGPK